MKHVFAVFEPLSCNINAIHSVHYAHIDLSLADPTLTEHSSVAAC